MVRVALTVYFSVVTLVSPWLCCCMIVQCKKVEKSVCPHCRVIERPSRGCCDPFGLANSKNTDPNKSKCPCRQQDRQTVAIVRAVDRQNVESTWLSAAAIAMLSSVPTTQCDVSHSMIMRPEDPFAENVRARLGLLCLLRC